MEMQLMCRRQLHPAWAATRSGVPVCSCIQYVEGAGCDPTAILGGLSSWLLSSGGKDIRGVEALERYDLF